MAGVLGDAVIGKSPGDSPASRMAKRDELRRQEAFEHTVKALVALEYLRWLEKAGRAVPGSDVLTKTKLEKGQS